MQFSFNSDRPDLSDAEVQFEHPVDAELARRYDALISSRAYLDRFDRGHLKAVADAQTLAETLWGDNPADGGPSVSSQTISSKDGSVLDTDKLLQQYAPTVWNPGAIADDANKRD